MFLTIRSFSLLLWLVSVSFVHGQTMHFQFRSNTGDWATLGIPLSANPNIDGTPLEAGDEIGVFTPSGLCVGGVVWNGEGSVALTVWGDDMITPEVDGIRPGERMFFRVWRRSTNTEIKVVEVSYETGDGIYMPRGIYKVSSLNAFEPPPPPIPMFPEPGAYNLPTTIEFRWMSQSTTTDGYAFELSLDQEFTNIVYHQDEIQDSLLLVSRLSHDTEYYWRVRAYNRGGGGAWSHILSFRTEVPKDSLLIQLSANWNLISSYVRPADARIEEIFRDVRDTLLFVKDGAGNVYWPETEINSIEFWDPSESYYVYLENPATLLLYGEVVDPLTNPLSLPRGWNYPAFLSRIPLTPEDAFNTIYDQIELVKTHDGLLFWPAYNHNTIGMLQPGSGYQIYMNEDGILKYPENPETNEKVDESSVMVSMSRSMRENKRPTYYKPTFTNTGESAVILVLNDKLRHGDEIGVWGEGDMLIGSGLVENGKAAIVVWGDNARTTNKEGGIHGERLRLTSWSQSDRKEVALSITRLVDLIDGSARHDTLRYYAEGIFIVETDVRPIPIGIPARYFLYPNYPNPFNPATVIRYSIPDDVRVQLTVYNTLGQKVAVLTDEEQPAGYYETVFNGENLASGVYIVYLKAGYYVEARKMTLIR